MLRRLPRVTHRTPTYLLAMIGRSELLECFVLEQVKRSERELLAARAAYKTERFAEARRMLHTATRELAQAKHATRFLPRQQIDQGARAGWIYTEQSGLLVACVERMDARLFGARRALRTRLTRREAA